MKKDKIEKSGNVQNNVQNSKKKKSINKNKTKKKIIKEIMFRNAKIQYRKTTK